MKKKILTAGMGIICIILIVCLVVTVQKINENAQQEHPAGSTVRDEENPVGDTLPEDTSSTLSGQEDLEQKAVEQETSGEEEMDAANPIEKGLLKLEILDYRYVDKPEDYEDYHEEYMYYENLPNPGTDIIMKETVDYDAVYKEMPEYEDMDKNPDKYTIDESIAISQKAGDIIDKYTYDVEVPCDYLFIRCRLTNTLDKGKEAVINDQGVAVLHDGEWNYVDDHLLMPVYFDKSQKANTDMAYFFYDMAAGEVLEYTIAFQVEEKASGGVYYYGVPDNIVDADGIPQSPVRQTMYMRRLFLREEGAEIEE